MANFLAGKSDVPPTLEPNQSASAVGWKKTASNNRTHWHRASPMESLAGNHGQTQCGTQNLAAAFTGGAIEFNLFLSLLCLPAINDHLAKLA